MQSAISVFTHKTRAIHSWLCTVKAELNDTRKMSREEEDAPCGKIEAQAPYSQLPNALKSVLGGNT